MKYTENQETYDQAYKIKGLGEVRYESRRSFKKRYPNEDGGYRVIGAIGKGVKKEKGTWEYREGTKNYYELRFSKIWYRIAGYIEVEENTYLAVVKINYMRMYELVGALAVVLLLLLGGNEIIKLVSGPQLESGLGKYEINLKRPEDMDQTKILIPGYTDIKIEEKSKEAYIALWNPDDNPCYFTFSIVLRDTGEVLYNSKLIPPGYAITTVPLKRSFEKGEYPIIVRIKTYDLEDHTKSMNGGEVKTRMIVIGEGKNK